VFAAKNGGTAVQVVPTTFNAAGVRLASDRVILAPTTTTRQLTSCTQTVDGPVYSGAISNPEFILIPDGECTEIAATLELDTTLVAGDVVTLDLRETDGSGVTLTSPLSITVDAGHGIR
jgi:hypothetical protein